MVNVGFKIFLFLLLQISLGIFPETIGAQTFDVQENSIIDASERLIFSNPNEAIRIAIQLSKNENNSNFENAKINYILSKSYLIKGDYNNSLKSLYASKNHEFYLSDFERNDILISKIRILRELSLDKESKQFRSIRLRQIRL